MATAWNYHGTAAAAGFAVTVLMVGIEPSRTVVCAFKLTTPPPNHSGYSTPTLADKNSANGRLGNFAQLGWLAFQIWIRNTQRTNPIRVV